MAGYAVNPGPFRAVPADPEGTLEKLEDYCRTMEMVFRLSRRVTATGNKRDFDDSDYVVSYVFNSPDLDNEKNYKEVIFNRLRVSIRDNK